MSNTGETELFEELLKLLEEEQRSPKGPSTANDDLEKREYRCVRIKELASRLGSSDEAKS